MKWILAWGSFALGNVLFHFPINIYGCDHSYSIICLQVLCSIYWQYQQGLIFFIVLPFIGICGNIFHHPIASTFGVGNINRICWYFLLPSYIYRDPLVSLAIHFLFCQQMTNRFGSSNGQCDHSRLQVKYCFHLWVKYWFQVKYCFHWVGFILRWNIGFKWSIGFTQNRSAAMSRQLVWMQRERVGLMMMMMPIPGPNTWADMSTEHIGR